MFPGNWCLWTRSEKLLLLRSVGHRGGIAGLGYATVWPMNINCHQPMKPCTLKMIYIYIHIQNLSKPLSMMSLMPFYLMAKIRFIRPLFSKEHHLIQLKVICSYIHNVFHVKKLIVTLLPKTYIHIHHLIFLETSIYFHVEKIMLQKKPSQNSSPTFAVAMPVLQATRVSRTFDPRSMER